MLRSRWIGLSYLAGSVLGALVLAGVVLRITGVVGTSSGPKPTTSRDGDRATPAYVAREIQVGPEAGYLRVGLGAVWVAHGTTQRRIARIEDETGSIEAQIPVGGGLEGVAVTEAGLWFFRPGTGFSFVDRDTNRVTVRVPFRSDGVDLVSVGEDLWFSTLEGEVRRLDPDTRTIGRALRIGAPGQLNLVAFGEGRLWVAHQAGLELVAIDPDRGRIDARFRLPGAPFVVGSGAGRVWVTSATGGRLWGVDPSTGRIERTVAVGEPAGDLAAGADAVWVRAGGDRLIEVDADTARIRNRYRLPPSNVPFAVELAPDAVWVSNWSAGTVWEIRPTA